MRQADWRDRLRYAFDTTLAHGPLGLVLWLGVVSALIISAGVAAVSLFGLAPEPTSLPELTWTGLMRALDSGAVGGDTGPWSFRLTMLAVTFGGIFVLSALIGTITSGIDARLAELRKGRSRVVERDHTVVLGWSEQVFAVLSELAEANRSRRGACVVVLADQDSVAMHDAIRARIPARGTRFVCRSGSPTAPADLAILGLEAARSVIVLSPEGDEADMEVVKTLLALAQSPHARSAPFHVVAEIRDAAMLAPARLAGGARTEILQVSDTVSRIIAQTSKQPGLSVVYQELLDFDGDEIYFRREPSLAGLSFGDALGAYPRCALLGLRPAGGEARLLPGMDTVLGKDDELILIASDDTAIALGLPAPEPDASAIALREPGHAAPERILVLGWNRGAPRVLLELDRYLAPGSTVTVVADDDDLGEAVAQLGPRLERTTLASHRGVGTERALLESLHEPPPDQVIVLCCGDRLSAEQADARTLVTLLHLRDIAERSGRRVPVVSEMLDIRNRDLAEMTRADDFVVSDRLISLLLAQVSENRHLNAVFADLFDADGAEIYLKAAGDYLQLGRPVDVYTVVEAARRKGELAIGYRLAALAGDASRSYGVVLNPDKGGRVAFEEGDRLIVLAED